MTKSQTKPHVSAGEREAEHSIFDCPSSELIFFFFLEKKLKINRGHTLLFSFCYCKAHVQFKSGIVENKATKKWSTGWGSGEEEENQALQKSVFNLPSNPWQRGTSPCPPTPTLSPHAHHAPTCPCRCSSSLRKCMYNLSSAAL